MLKHNHLASISAALIAAIVLLFTSCVPENPDPNADLPKGAIRLTAPGYKTNDGTKLGVDQYGAQVHFIEGDEIWINGETYTVQIAPNGSAYISDNEPGKDPISYPVHAIYPASLVTSSTTFNATNHTISGITIPCALTSKIPTPLPGASTSQTVISYSVNKLSDSDPVRQANVAAPLIGYKEANSNEISFQHLAAALILAIDNPTDLDITITDAAIAQKQEYRLASTVTTDISFSAPSIPHSTGGTDPYYAKIEFNDEAPFTIPAGKTGYIQIPILPVLTSQFEFAFTATHDSENDGVAPFEFYFVRTQLPGNSSRRKIERGQMAYIPITFNPNHNYSDETNSNYPFYTDGLFSISATEKIYFAKGNLKYRIPDDATGTSSDPESHYKNFSNWVFFQNQYDRLEDNRDFDVGNNNTSGDNTKLKPFYTKNADEAWMSLFNFGATGELVSPRLLPLKTATAYTGTYNTIVNQAYPGKISDNDIQGTDHDWGCRVGEGWFTLSETQWKYLLALNTDNNRILNKHGGGTGPAYVTAKIDQTFGLIIFPDRYWEKSGRATISSEDQITLATWNDMEKDGVVFLPAAGAIHKKSNTQISASRADSEKYFRYWTSTMENSSQYKCGRYLSISSNTATIGNGTGFTATSSGGISNHPYSSCAVRLVRRATTSTSSGSK